MLAAHQTQLQQPPGMPVLRKLRDRVALSRPITDPAPYDPLKQRRGLDGLVHGTTTKRAGPGLYGEPRQVTPMIFSSTWPGLNVELKHFQTQKPRGCRNAREMGRMAGQVDNLTPRPTDRKESGESASVSMRKRRSRTTKNSLPSEDTLSAQNTPERLRLPISRTDLTNASANSIASEETQIPRRYMRNGVLLFDHRFDPEGTALKDDNGHFKMSPFNTIRTLRRSTPEQKEMIEVIRMCAEYQGGTARLPPVESPQYFKQPLSPSGRFESPTRRPEKRVPLGNEG